MSRRSLRLRLALAGVVSCGLALIFAFFGLSLLFERHVERRILDELTVHLDQVIAGLDRTANGHIDVLRLPADPRFRMPLSGLYWQIDVEGTQRFSRSLWDTALTLPDIHRPGVQQASIAGPAGVSLIAVVRDITTEARLGHTPVQAAVAIDRSVIDQATAAYRRDMIPYLALLAAVLLIASMIQIFIGLQPLADLRRRITLIRNGSVDRLGEAFPDEVLPLTVEVDALLQVRDDQLQRARERASALAHGFKTPLQVLTGDVSRLEAAGQAAIAKDLDTVIKAMRRLVDHEMTRARIAVSGHRASSDLAKVAAGVIAVARRTPDGQRIDWKMKLQGPLLVRMDADDLAEVLGNLAENAMRYGKSEVTVYAGRDAEFVVAEFIDDGPGIPEEQLQHVLRRGNRLDTTSGGAGLGLAICESIIQTSGGTIALENMHPGLRVRLALPAASAVRSSS
ncbi:sensor histidine kinase [Metarhizobium album]|uniref:histidine kinase n=1 Tax=Metarhizobium album TaxID=2182425 RepID=A0A2U2DRQ5_9HYPH|nr:HAMP domain-containing sensor histidine kinase [Rhizobium album]PWE55977.1 sensor histidine kinase [Rhizobium album]